MTFVNVKPMERIIARLRARGFVVNEHSGWRTRGVDGRDMKRAQSLLMHHDVSRPPANYPLASMIKNGRGQPGTKGHLKGPLSQWGVGRQGTIEVLAAGLAYHAGRTRNDWSANDRAQGCEAANRGTGSVKDPDEPWPAASMAAQRALAEEFMREYDVGTNRIRGHKEECLPAGRKIDPVHDMDAFRSSLSDKPTIPAVPLPVTEEKDWFDMATKDDLRREIDAALAPIKDVLGDHTRKLDESVSLGRESVRGDRVIDDRVNKGFRAAPDVARTRQIVQEVAGALPEATVDALVQRLTGEVGK